MKKETIIKLRRTILIFWVVLSIIVLAAILYLGIAYPELQNILQKGILIFIGISLVVGSVNAYLTNKIRK